MASKADTEEAIKEDAELEELLKKRKAFINFFMMQDGYFTLSSAPDMSTTKIFLSLVR